MHHEIKYMNRCIELASKANKNTLTNPKVGAVLVCEGRIIGEGFHQEYGKSHAEVNALENVSLFDQPNIPDSTLYVSLEPCSHFGKTPPCAHRIVQEGIKKVVIGNLDPNPIVSGRGVRYLQENGVDVYCLTNSHEADELIHNFKANLTGIPYIILKWAQSSDNYISKIGEQTWLSNEYSRILAHKWRSECDGIMVGKNTFQTDKPALNVRMYHGENPIKIVMDSHLELKSLLTNGIDEGFLWVVNNIDSATDKNIRYIQTENINDLKLILNMLFKEGINTLLVEGGAILLKSFISSGLWHEARIIRTKKVLHDGVKAPLLHGSLMRKMQLAEDEILFIKNKMPVPHE